MRKIYLLLFAFTLITQGLLGQSAGAFEKHAKKSFEERQYCNALEFAKEALDRDSTKAVCINIAAKSAFSLRLFGKSKFYFQQLQSCTESAQYTNTVYYLAEINRITGKRAQAIPLYQTFISQATGDADLLEDASAKIEICSSYDEPSAEDDPCYEGIKVNRVPELYTCESELGPFQWQGKIYYTSTEFECNPSTPCNNKLVVYEYDGTNSNAIRFPDTEGDISHMTFNADGSRMYYNECDCDKNLGFICHIFYRDWSVENNAWGAKVKLSKTVNVPGKTATQPRIGESLEGGGERLYYVSNRDGCTGGEGDLDIWYVDIIDGECGTPVNFSQVNTSDKDITPFYDRATNIFYYSSTGRNGIGGFDIYRLDMTNRASNIEVMPTPINSIYDDLYFSMGDCKGHFTSNRPEEGEGGIEAESCCLDPNIYEVEWRRQLDLEVTVFEVKDSISYGQPVYGADNEILQVRRPLNDVAVTLNGGQEQRDEYSNFYSYTDVEFDADFEVKGTKIGYSDGAASTTSSGFSCGCSTIKVELELRKKAVKLIVNTKEKFGQKDLGLGSTVQQIDYNTIQAYPPALVNLDLWISLNDPIQPINDTKVQLMDWPSRGEVDMKREATVSQYEFELDFDKNYYLIGSKESYTSDTTEYFTTDIATLEAQITSDPKVVSYSEDGDTIIITKNLYLFKPLPLYFDHAFPRIENYSNTRSLPTNRTYYNYYEEFSSKESSFKAGCYGSRDEEVGAFFLEDLYGGMTRLQNFAPYIAYFLDKGYKINVVIEGGASGRQLSAAYDNNALSERRAISLENYFRGFTLSDGSKPLENAFEVSWETSRSACGICSSTIGKKDDDCSGKYSRQASRDRRVRIVDIKFDRRYDEAND